jgi:isocitrate lyase
LRLAIERGLRYLDSGLPDLVWCEFPNSERGPAEVFATEIRKRFPEARLAFNWSSSFKWHLEPRPLRFEELGQMGFRFIFITLAAIHAGGLGFSKLLQNLANQQEQAYIALQHEEWAEGADLPSRSHHLFSGVPYHHLVGDQYGAARLGREVAEEHREQTAV